MSVPFTHPFQENQFDIFEWYPKFQSCLRYFLDHAQYSSPVQTVAAFVNIKLPYQNPQVLLDSQPGPPTLSAGARIPSTHPDAQQTVLVIPYIRRLVATSFDTPPVLHGFFGDDWEAGIGSLHESERRNFLFACKSDTWNAVKRAYDMEDGQTVPFLRGPYQVSLGEIESAEAGWSEWLAMQDWMLGPRAPTPDGTGGTTGTRIKTERR